MGSHSTGRVVRPAQPLVVVKTASKRIRRYPHEVKDTLEQLKKEGATEIGEPQNASKANCSDECKEAQACVLTKSKDSKMFCCSPNETGHHLIPGHNMVEFQTWLCLRERPLRLRPRFAATHRRAWPDARVPRLRREMLDQACRNGCREPGARHPASEVHTGKACFVPGRSRDRSGRSPNGVRKSWVQARVPSETIG